MGLATDTAFCLWTARQLQAAADAAALAGAQRVRTDVAAAMQAAITLAQDNKAGGTAVLLASNNGNAAGGDVVVGVFDSQALTFTPTLTSPNAVKVNARRTGSSLGGPVSLLFGPIFGINIVDISRSAIALAGGVGAGMVVLDRSAPGSLSATGNATITVTNGAIQVDSSSSSAISATGNVMITAAETNVVGNASTTGNTVINMAPGIYILGGAGISLTGNSILNAQGVMLYVTGTGSVDLTGNGLVTLTPPNPSVNNFPGATTYAGVSIFQDRADKTADSLTGNGNLNIQGTVYLNAATLTLTGNSNTLGNQVIVDQLRFVGNANVTIPYDGRNPVGSMSSWLVQ